jgi:polyferredoxin
MIFLVLYMSAGIINSAHQFCPYSIVCFGTMFPRGIITYSITVILSLFILFITVLIGRKFCSYICFLGTLQEKIYSLNRKKYTEFLPLKLHKILKYLKYFVLAVTLSKAILLIQYSYFKICPVLLISFFSRIALQGFIILVVFLILSFLIERFWCRYLCPYGALMNIFQLAGKLSGIKRQKIIRNLPESINCKNCLNYCPMGIELGGNNIIESVECIHCLKCVRVCQKSDPACIKCIYKDNL